MEPQKETHDIGLAWNWEHDRDFALLIDEGGKRRGVRTYHIHKENVDDVLGKLKKETLHFRFFFDRASDEDERFRPVARYLAEKPRSAEQGESARLINPYEFQAKAADKATMHLEFLSHGIDVPHTIIISPFSDDQDLKLTDDDLVKLGKPFVIKPANTTGGGTGVVLGAETLGEVLSARRAHKNDKYLLQETVKPAYLSESKAWFRVFYAFGEIIPCWWDDRLKVYEELIGEEELAFELHALRTITSQIQRICKLDFFSTEIVYTLGSKFVAVDYVNEVCDMRLQSKFPDGVPDTIVHRIVRLLIDRVAGERA